MNVASRRSRCRSEASKRQSGLRPLSRVECVRPRWQHRAASTASRIVGEDLVDLASSKRRIRRVVLEMAYQGDQRFPQRPTAGRATTCRDLRRPWPGTWCGLRPRRTSRRWPRRRLDHRRRRNRSRAPPPAAHRGPTDSWRRRHRETTRARDPTTWSSRQTRPALLRRSGSPSRASQWLGRSRPRRCSADRLDRSCAVPAAVRLWRRRHPRLSGTGRASPRSAADLRRGLSTRSRRRASDTPITGMETRLQARPWPPGLGWAAEAAERGRAATVALCREALVLLRVVVRSGHLRTGRGDQLPDPTLLGVLDDSDTLSRHRVVQDGPRRESSSNHGGREGRTSHRLILSVAAAVEESRSARPDSLPL